MSHLVKAAGGRYRIGAVARFTGLTTSGIRVWERRYGALTPARSERGGRLYDDADVERLVLLRRLLEAGHSIGTIAALPEAELERLAAARAPIAPPAHEVRQRFLAAVSRL